MIRDQNSEADRLELAEALLVEEEDARFAQFRVDKVFAETDSIRKEPQV